MRIEAATLAGGKVNQDYYAYGETYALVLDGATSFVPEKTSIDAATYVQALGAALATRLESCSLNEIPDVVAAAIGEIAVKYKLAEESSPNSTVAIAKWDRIEVVTYVLGDSGCFIIDKNYTVTEMRDNRMAEFGNKIRRQYKKRLSEGSGFDAKHKKLLGELQRHQKKYRNVENGYWIAGAAPESAFKGIIEKYELSKLNYLILGSDGGLLSVINSNLKVDNPVSNILKDQQDKELWDNQGVLLPRSKLNDDKTIIRVIFSNQSKAI